MNYLTTDTELTAMADAIRTKTGSSAPISYAQNTGFSSAISDIPSGGDTVVWYYHTHKITNKTSFTASNIKITIPKTGTYHITWFCFSSSSASSSCQSRLAVNGTLVGTAHTLNQYSSISVDPSEETLSLNEDDEVVVMVKTRSGSSYYATVIGIIAEKQ